MNPRLELHDAVRAAVARGGELAWRREVKRATKTACDAERVLRLDAIAEGRLAAAKAERRAPRSAGILRRVIAWSLS